MKKIKRKKLKFKDFLNFIIIILIIILSLSFFMQFFMISNNEIYIEDIQLLDNQLII